MEHFKDYSCPSGQVLGLDSEIYGVVNAIAPESHFLRQAGHSDGI